MRPLSLSLLFVLAGCPSEGSMDKDTDDSDASTDTSTDDTGDDDTGDTGDTGVEDTDDTDVDSTLVDCAFDLLPPLSDASAEPGSGTTITFVRTIQGCVTDDDLDGRYHVEITNPSNELLCRYVSTFSSTTATTSASCADCDVFSSVTWNDPVRTGWDCGVFGWDDRPPFYGTNNSMELEYTTVAVTTDPDFVYEDVDDGWKTMTGDAEGGATTAYEDIEYKDADRATAEYRVTYDY